MNGKAGADFAESQAAFGGKSNYGAEGLTFFRDIEGAKSAGQGETSSGGGITVTADGDFTFAFDGYFADKSVAGFGRNHFFVVKTGVNFVRFDIEKWLFFIFTGDYGSNAAVGIFDILIGPVGNAAFADFHFVKIDGNRSSVGKGSNGQKCENG